MIPKLRPEWVILTDRRQEFLCLSEATPWVSHWDVDAGRSRKCAGARCWLCHCGVPKVLRVIILVIDDQGRERLLELRERHRPLWESSSLVGARLHARKEGLAKNSPVVIARAGREEIAPRDISRLIECLGLPPALIATVDLPECLSQIPLQELKEQKTAARNHDDGQF